MDAFYRFVRKRTGILMDQRGKPKTTCPLTRLYWAFLDRHRPQLENNPRMLIPLRALAQRPKERREEDARTFAAVSEALAAGQEAPGVL